MHLWHLNHGKTLIESDNIIVMPYIFYADLKQQRFTVEENNILPDELNPENHDILGALCSSACLEEMEKKKVQGLYARIEQGMREPINMKELETRAHIKTQAGKVELMAILCYLETDENGLVTEYVGLIRPLRKQELQEREILLAFSNDKKSIYFLSIESQNFRWHIRKDSTPIFSLIFVSLNILMKNMEAIQEMRY